MIAPVLTGSASTIESRIAALATGASFEMIASDLVGLEEARAWLAPGTMVSVTWLPTESDDDRVRAAVAINRAGLVPLPHVAARRIAGAAELERFVGRLAEEAGVTRAFLIAGDVRDAIGPYRSSAALLDTGLFARHGYDAIGITGYPEGHPGIADDVLAAELVTKADRIGQQAMTPFVVTQFGFRATPIVDWLQRLRRVHPALPVRIGLAGPATLRTLLRYAALCGVGTSAKAIVGQGASIARLLTEAGPDPVIRALAASPAFADLGPVALHLFPFGGLARTARWLAPVAQGRFVMRSSEAGFRPDTGDC